MKFETRYLALVLPANILLLSMSMLIAIQLRLELPIGKVLGAEYKPYNLKLLLLLLVASFLSFGIAALLTQLSMFHSVLHIRRQMRILFFAGILLIGLAWLLVPQLSQLQLLYFMATNGLLGLLMIYLPAKLRLSAYRQSSVLEDIALLIEKNYMLRVWLAYRIRSRYAETMLGIVWILVFPLATSLVLAFAMTNFLGVRTVDVPFVPFLLSGQVMFMIFSSVVQNSTSAIAGMLGIIKQVYFPREIIILLILGEALVDFLFLFIASVVVSALFGIMPNIYFVYIPLLVLLMVCLTTGIAFIMSWLSLRVRDIAPLTSVVLQLLFYVTVFFRDSVKAREVQILQVLNPLSGIVEAYRDIVLYGRPPDIRSMYAAIALSFAILYLGYVYFKVNEDRFADFT